MNDRELLEAAAKAAGHRIVEWAKDGNGVDVAIIFGGEGWGRERPWQPLLENQMADADGDALRLAIVCRLTVCTDGDATVWRNHDPDGVFVTQSVRECGDKHAATRRAITRAAAEIGKGMP